MRWLIRLMAMLIAAEVALGYTGQIAEVGMEQLEKAKTVVSLYNQRTQELDSLLEGL